MACSGRCDDAQRADHFALDDGDEVGGGEIVLVVFELFGHVLLPDKDLAAHGEGGVAQAGKGGNTQDGNIGVVMTDSETDGNATV